MSKTKKEPEPKMSDVDIIIPAYGSSKLLNKGIASIATQWKAKFIHVTIVDDCSPNTDCHYQDLVDIYTKMGLDIRVVVTPENRGQGGARQFGVDNTKRKWFMFMDEDDMFGSPIAVSQFMGFADSYNWAKDPNGNILLDPSTGKPAIDKSIPKLALVAGPLFEFDEYHTHTIKSDNHVWINSKLYNREFINKHGIRFNKAQSRHAEDYFWTSCFFYALDHDLKYTGIMMDDDSMTYIWYPNFNSQSRSDPHYGFMLSGYTMDGSVNILKYMRDTQTNHLKWNDDMEKEWRNRLLNMTVYSYYTFLAFIRHLAETDYNPPEQDWYILRNACERLRLDTAKEWHHYNYMQILEELVGVKNYSDVQYTLPWIEFDKYIIEGMEELHFSYTEIMRVKKNYKFYEDGRPSLHISCKNKETS